MMLLSCFLLILKQSRAADFAEEGSRYDGQIAVLGQDFQKRLANLK